MRGTLLLLALLAAIWVALSGHYSTEPVVLVMAVISVVLSGWLAARMDRAAGEAGLPPETGRILLRLPVYGLWLAWQIVLANLHVIRLVLDPRTRLEPAILRVRARQRSALVQVIHANSITLTPGTITLDLRNGELLVHALSAGSAASVLAGDMDRAASRLEGGG
jgi:multicomponent Na+:H+ antiporter subunit E